MAEKNAPVNADSAVPVDQEQRKTNDILEACKWRNIEALKGLASTKGGFLTDILRRKACQ